MYTHNIHNRLVNSKFGGDFRDDNLIGLTSPGKQEASHHAYHQVSFVCIYVCVYMCMYIEGVYICVCLYMYVYTGKTGILSSR
jgi:hypothetical protein